MKRKIDDLDLYYKQQYCHQSQEWRGNVKNGWNFDAGNSFEETEKLCKSQQFTNQLNNNMIENEKNKIN